MSQWGSPVELARQLCVANHTRTNVVNPIDRAVPCGKHLSDANRFYGLTSPDGAATLEVLNDWAAKRGEPKAEAVTIEEKLAQPHTARMLEAARQQDLARQGLPGTDEVRYDEAGIPMNA